MKRAKNIFNDFKKKISDSIPDTSLQLTCDEHPVHGVYNSYSIVTLILLYMYSMEFGDPPLYAEVNRVCRDMDMS